MNIDDNRRIPKTKEEKEATKALKLLEKQKRKDKSLQKLSNKNDETNLCIATQNISVSKKNVETKINQNRVRKASDMVSFDEQDTKPTSSRITDNLVLKSSQSDTNLFVRKLDPRQPLYFEHLFYPDRRENIVKIIDSLSDSDIHPEFKKFGIQLDSHMIRGSTLRCQQFLAVLKKMIIDLSLNKNENFSHRFSIAFDKSVDFLSKCRQMSVTMYAAVNYLKSNLPKIFEPDNEKSRQIIIDMIDQFLKDRIDAAHASIQTLTADYIKNDYSVLVYSFSQVVLKSIQCAWLRMRQQEQEQQTGTFNVFVVDTFPDSESQKMIDALEKQEIPYYRISLSVVPRIMDKINLIVLGAHSVMSNGNVVSCSGSASVANIAKSFNKKLIVCSETYKFTTKNHLDSFEFNELANPSFLVEKILQYSKSSKEDLERLKNWRDVKNNITPLDIMYDVIPADWISGICCEFGIFYPTAVSYVSSVKQPY